MNNMVSGKDQEWDKCACGWGKLKRFGRCARCHLAGQECPTCGQEVLTEVQRARDGIQKAKESYY